MPVTADLRIFTDDTYYSDVWPVLVGGLPVDLTGDGWTLRAQVRPRAGADEVLLDFAALEGGIRVSATSPGPEPGSVVPSTVQLHIPAADAAQLSAWVGVWDLEISHPTHDHGSLWRETVVSGVARCAQGVTR